MKVRVGDKVKVLAGKDKGKEGVILKTLRTKDRVIVEGVNIIKKHQKPTRTNEAGSIIEIEASIHVSNVKVLESTGSKKKEVKKTAAKKEVVKETKKKASK